LEKRAQYDEAEVTSETSTARLFALRQKIQRPNETDFQMYHGANTTLFWS
jgi:hypothetical protein